MAPTKNLLVDELIEAEIPDLTGALNYQVTAVLSDHRKYYRSAVALATLQLHDDGKNQGEPIQCVIKVFPKGKPNAQTEMVAYARLLRFERENAQGQRLRSRGRGRIFANPVQAMKAISSEWQGSELPQWPYCFGRLRVPESILSSSDFAPRRGDKNLCDALVLEYIEGVELLTKSVVTDDYLDSTMAVLEKIHAAGLVHRDLEEMGAFPDVGFRNIFVRPSGRDSAGNSVTIMDFDHSLVISRMADIKHAAEEKDRVKELFKRSMSGENPLDHLPKEARKLFQ